MPADREGQRQRREAIREMLMGEPRIEEQGEIVARLKERGIVATQSSVSRDLKDLGAVRSKGYYMIPSWEEEEEESPFRRVVDFILEVKPAGPYQTLLITEPGAAGIVAQAIDAAEWEDIVGTLAGDSSVLILTEHVFFQRLLFDRLRYYMAAEVEEKAEEEEKAE
ncbi:MAG: transcriptional regulator of arginine metabolism [Acidobacteriota bacterium]|jgi:transcriptional regulator of arginine metabolism|nr:transcriptional regulator of arginine metabolism [Acidobacteriota bacterium]